MIDRTEDNREYNAMRSDEYGKKVECDSCSWSGYEAELVEDFYNDINWFLCPDCGNPPMSCN